MTDGVLHLTGPVLLGVDEEVGQAWVAEGRLTLTPPPGAATAHPVPGWVLPGLVDAHCHVGLGPDGAVDVATQEEQLRTDRDAGTLLIRDAGSPADTRWADDRPDLPRLIRAGRHLAAPRRYLPGVAVEVAPEELVAEVRRQARAGDGWVKLVGDWIDRDLGDLAPCWPAAVLAEAVAAAHAEGARVTAHCFGEDCLPDLVAVGIDCLEHATGLDEETLGAVARAGIAIVPTLVNIDTFPAIAARAEGKFPVYAAHLRRLHAQRHRTVGDAYDAGVAVFAGTDAGGSLPHGLLAKEVAELVRAGLPVTSALDAACWGARSWLGRPGLAEGAPADLVVYPQDPRREPGVLANPTAVVLGGRILDARSTLSR